MRNVSIAILDDEVLHIQNMKEVIDKCSDGKIINIQEYTKSGDLLDCGDPYDIILVDMELKEKGKPDEGLDFVRAYRAKGKDALMIFVTTHDELARDGYKVKAFGYVFKDKLEDELTDALMSAYKELADSRSVSFFVIKENKNIINESKKEILVKDIRYVETEGRHIRIHLDDENFLVNSTLSNVLEELNDGRFCMSQKSYVVNMRYAVGINGKELTMSDGKKLPIGRTRRKEIEEAYWVEKRRRR